MTEIKFFPLLIAVYLSRLDNGRHVEVGVPPITIFLLYDLEVMGRVSQIIATIEPDTYHVHISFITCLCKLQSNAPQILPTLHVTL